jgi:hypothetical protein
MHWRFAYFSASRSDRQPLGCWVHSRLLQRNVDRCELNFLQNLLCNGPLIPLLSEGRSIARVKTPGPALAEPDGRLRETRPSASPTSTSLIGFRWSSTHRAAPIISPLLDSVCRRDRALVILIRCRRNRARCRPQFIVGIHPRPAAQDIRAAPIAHPSHVYRWSARPRCFEHPASIRNGSLDRF